MHSLETIKFINSPRQSAKIARANTIFNRGPAGHAKAGEKGFHAPKEAGCGHWVTAAEWDRTIARRKSQRNRLTVERA